MTKKRLRLDLDLEDYNDKKIWDYLQTKKVKSKAIKSIISAYLDSEELLKINSVYCKKNKEKECVDNKELLNKDDIDSSAFVGF